MTDDQIIANLTRERDRATLEAIRGIYAEGAVPIPATSLVRHDPLTGRAYVHLSHTMVVALRQMGQDVGGWKADHEESLQRCGLWPGDILPSGTIEGTFTER